MGFLKAQSNPGVFFFGPADSGKTTAITLIHLTALAMTRREKIIYYPPPGDNSASDLYALGNRLGKGYKVDATKPEEGLVGHLMTFGFPRIGPFKSKLEAAVADVPGDIWEAVGSNPNESAHKRAVDALMRRYPSLTPDKAERLWDEIFAKWKNAVSYVLVSNVSELKKMKGDDTLARFLGATVAMKQKNKDARTAKNISLLLTHCDQDDALTKDCRDRGIDDFTEKYLQQTMGLCKVLEREHNCSIKKFGQLLEEDSNGRFKTDSDGNIVYHKDIFEEVIWVFRGLVT